MKAFRFTLEAVQTLRLRQEQQAIEIYVHALLARQQAADRLETARERIRRNQQEISRLLAAACAAAPLAQAGYYECALEKQELELAAAMALAERRVQASLKVMLSARQRRKMVENFRAKQLVRHLRNQWREEQKLTDDLASRRGRSILSWHPDESPL
jgi:flagellar export protein FliJ